MNISAIICEFNPFHNGHAYLLEQVRRQTQCDAVLCIMSGSFTQRGEMCILDKYRRARHAVLNGADAVIELPAHFAVAPAEIFADGAVCILSRIPSVNFLGFGCEIITDFDAVAAELLDESGKFRKILRERLDAGEGYAAAYAAAVGRHSELLNTPNNILAVEYAKANIRHGRKLTLCPVERKGAGYHGRELGGQFASARAIRENKESEALKDFVPQEVLSDLVRCEDRSQRFKQLAADALFFADAERLKRIYGCTEGLENRLKKLSASGDYDEIILQGTGKRYPASRIRRILAANLLGLFKDDAERLLQGAPSARVLAVRKDMADALLPLISPSAPPPEDAGYAVWRYINYPSGEENVREKTVFIE